MKRFKMNLKTIIGSLALGVFSFAAIADDIELFTGYTSTGDAPNVLFVLDNAAKFSANNAVFRCSISPTGEVDTTGNGSYPTNLDGKTGAVEQCALYSALSTLASSTTAKINIGVMGFNSNGVKTYDPVTNSFPNSCTTTNGGTGGCVMMPLSPFDTTTKPRILEWIRNWNVTTNSSNYLIKGDKLSNGAVMQEAWAYYSGRTGISGKNYDGATNINSCANKFVIFVGNAYEQQAFPGDQKTESTSPKLPFGTSSTGCTSQNPNKCASPAATATQRATITRTYKTACSSQSTTITSAEDEGNGGYALKWARYMKAHDITTYSIGILGPSCNQEYAAHLMALGSEEIGGGKFFGTTNFSELKIAFQTAISEIQSVNSAFAAVSLPVSVNTQGTYLNQVYIGMFRPAQNFNPRWPGNLKQYRIGYNNGVLKLLDAPGNPAISSSGTGFISECARSYWTSSSPNSYWGTYFEDANCTGFSESSDSPDGNVVEKGAQGYKLRSMTPATRVVKTCSTSSCSGLTSFDQNISTSLVSKTDLGNSSMTDADRTTLINWARGSNNNTDETFIDSANMRPSVHGDIVHSRPVAINYGTDTAPSVVVYYGGNDGLLHAINGNRDGISSSALTSDPGNDPGEEVWSFMPPEFYGKIKRLRDNSPTISFSGSTVTGAQPKGYGVDGTIVGYVGTSSKWIYATMRRGGKTLYAFDVTTPTTPLLKWRVGCVGSTCSGAPGHTTDNFSAIGQTWSPPSILKVSNYDTGNTPLLVMGGGYDTCEDTDNGTANHSCSSPTGNKIYVMDAFTGELLQTFTTDRSVVAGITIVPDANGNAQYGYTADTGGNVYRITMLNAAPSSWTLTKIASLGCGPKATSTCSANRKFLFAPDVGVSGSTYYVMLGSGDREKPLLNYAATQTVDNYFFTLKDYPGSTSWLSEENTSTKCNASALCLNSLTPTGGSNSPTTAELATSKGWYLSISDNEQVVTGSILVSNVISFSTHIPSTPNVAACSTDLGTSRTYNVYLADASAVGSSRYQTNAGGGLAPSPVAGIVRIDADGDGVEDDEVPFCIGCGSTDNGGGGGGGDDEDTSSLEVKEKTGTASWSQPKSRVYWYIQE